MIDNNYLLLLLLLTARISGLKTLKKNIGLGQA